MTAGDGYGPIPGSLADWQDHLREVQHLKGVPPSVAWLRVVEQAGDVAKCIRTDDLTQLSDGLLLAAPVVSLVWFANVMEFSLSDATWAKYPSVCPYCAPDDELWQQIAQDAPRFTSQDGFRALRACSCPPPPKRRKFDPSEPWLQEFRSRLDMRPSSLDEWQAMFELLYAHRHLQLGDLAYHFIEEIGEVAGEVRRRDVTACSYEAADVLSWILSLANTTSRALGLTSRLSVEHKLPDALDLLMAEEIQ